MTMTERQISESDEYAKHHSPKYSHSSISPGGDVWFGGEEREARATAPGPDLVVSEPLNELRSSYHRSRGRRPRLARRL